VPTNDPSDDGFLRFDVMIDSALRGVVREAVGHVIEHGLPGTHHFYLTFGTNRDGVEIPTALHDAHPEEMTVVLQNQFWDLNTDDEAFEVTLSFNRVRHRLRVPYAALTSFADPSVQFGLQFQTEQTPAASESTLPATASKPTGVAENETEETAPDGGDEKVVTLDTFRKK